MTANNNNHWGLILPFDPAGQRNRAHRQDRPAATPAPASQSVARSPAAVLDGLRDRFEVVVLGRAPATPIRRFYSDGRLDGHMQITRTRVR